MSLVVGENSYVSVAEADTYFAARYGYDLWDPLDDTSKEQALISAASSLDLMCDWYGRPTDPNQDMAFPRSPDTEVPQAIKDAQCEIAYQMVSAGSANVTESDPLTKMKADVVEFEWKATGGKTGGLATDYAKALLAPFGTCHYLSSGSRHVSVSRA